MTRRTFLAATGMAAAVQAAPRSGMGLSPDCFGIARAPRDAYAYMEYCHARGAGGAQGMLPPSFDAEYIKKLRARKDEYGMYLEITAALPTEETAPRFEQTVIAAKEAGALCMRSVCLGGRRYETFNTLDDFKRFATEAKAKLARAVKIVEKHRMPLGIENHKDWTIDQMVPLLESYSSEYLGTCIDWGNNISLLDDPMETAEKLAPFCINSHIKDMAVEEYEDGFLLAEVALGDGFFDLKRMLSAIQSKRPKVKYSLDMLTRDPLKIPCFTDKYWATFSERNGKFLARTIAMVRANKPKKPIARMANLTQEQRLQLEQDNVTRSLAYARDVLGLV